MPIPLFLIELRNLDQGNKGKFSALTEKNASSKLQYHGCYFILYYKEKGRK